MLTMKAGCCAVGSCAAWGAAGAGVEEEPCQGKGAWLSWVLWSVGVGWRGWVEVFVLTIAERQLFHAGTQTQRIQTAWGWFVSTHSARVGAAVLEGSVLERSWVPGSQQSSSWLQRCCCLCPAVDKIKQLFISE